MTTLRQRLRELLVRPEILIMPGAYDALSARIAAAHGFDALGCGGNPATASLLAEPDMGQMGLRDYADHYARLCEAVEIPILVDADTGFGGVHNVRRMVRAFERAGVAGLFFEDQATPKRCGYLAGKSVIPTDEMVAKVKAALDARRDADLVIVARTDALAVEGIEAAIERALLYKDAGADMIFVQGADRLEDLARICREVPGLHMANISQASGAQRAPSVDALQAAGAAAVTFPLFALLAAARAVAHSMAALRRDRSLAAVEDLLMPLDELYEVTGLASFVTRENACADAAARIAGKPRRKRA